MKSKILFVTLFLLALPSLNAYSSFQDIRDDYSRIDFKNFPLSRYPRSTRDDLLALHSAVFTMLDKAEKGQKYAPEQKEAIAIVDTFLTLVDQDKVMPRETRYIYLGNLAKLKIDLKNF